MTNFYQKQIIAVLIYNALLGCFVVSSEDSNLEDAPQSDEAIKLSVSSREGSEVKLDCSDISDGSVIPKMVKGWVKYPHHCNFLVSVFTDINAAAYLDGELRALDSLGKCEFSHDEPEL